MYLIHVFEGGVSDICRWQEDDKILYCTQEKSMGRQGKAGAREQAVVVIFNVHWLGQTEMSPGPKL
jgi:hypothetical protein